MSANTPQHLHRKAVVVFGDQTEVGWLRILKPGFRHCFVLLEVQEGWVMVDALAHWMHVGILPPVPSSQIASWYLSNGYTVVMTHHGQPTREPAPLAPFTCVEAVKRALGLRQKGVWTPYQLWKFLNRGKKSKYMFFSLDFLKNLCIM